MMDIENFVIDTLKVSRKWNGFTQQLEDLMQEIDFEYDPELCYSAYIQAFLKLRQINRFNDKVDYEQLTQLEFSKIQYIFTQFKRQNKRENKDFTQSEEKNQEQLTTYLNNLIEHYSKLLFIRVDLAYLKKEHGNVDIRLFRNDVHKLIGYIQDGDTCFQDIEGYAWALEQGEEKGYHCHLLLIYNGSARKKDCYYANQVIERWKEITKDDGYGFNCNTKEHKDQFRQRDKLGIGMIHRDNSCEVRNAINTCSYLVNPEKVDQHLRVKTPRMRTFGTGRYKRNNRRYRG